MRPLYGSLGVKGLRGGSEKYNLAVNVVNSSEIDCRLPLRYGLDPRSSEMVSSV